MRSSHFEDGGPTPTTRAWRFLALAEERLGSGFSAILRWRSLGGGCIKCERFFEFNHIEEERRVKLAVTHLDGKAIRWYHWFEKTPKEGLNWKDFHHIWITSPIWTKRFWRRNRRINQTATGLYSSCVPRTFWGIRESNHGINGGIHCQFFCEWIEGRDQGGSPDVQT